MKGIMASESSQKTDGVASFEYNPRDAHYQQGSLLDMLSTPLDQLSELLLHDYTGKNIPFQKLYEEHSVNRPYIKRNYKDVLIQLYQSGQITAINQKTMKPPRKGTFSDEMLISFGGRK